MILLTSASKNISNSCTILLTHWVTGNRQLKDSKLIIDCHTCAYSETGTAVNGGSDEVWWSTLLLVIVILSWISLSYIILSLLWKKKKIYFHLIPSYFINRLMKPQLTHTLKMKMLTHSPESPRFSHFGSSSTMKKFSCFSYSSTFIMHTCKVWLERCKHTQKHTIIFLKN